MSDASDEDDKLDVSTTPNQSTNKKSRSESSNDEVTTPLKYLNIVDRVKGNVLYDFQDFHRAPLNEWLEENAPGNIYQEIGADQWIIIRNWPDGMPKDENIVGLQKDWESLLDSGRPLNLESITELAKRNRVTGGNWIFFTNTSCKAQLCWNKVVTAISEGRLRSQTADVSQCDGTGEHVICVYNRDFTDLEQVHELERELREIGIYTQFMYKPNVYTYLNIYKGNEWDIRPTIYKSEYVIREGSSRITKLNSGPTTKPADSWRSK